MKIVFQEALTVKNPKILSLVPRSLYCSSNPLLILDLLTLVLSYSLKICRFPLPSHHTVHPFCDRLIYPTYPYHVFINPILFIILPQNGYGTNIEEVRGTCILDS